MYTTYIPGIVLANWAIICYRSHIIKGTRFHSIDWWFGGGLGQKTKGWANLSLVHGNQLFLHFSQGFRANLWQTWVIFWSLTRPKTPNGGNFSGEKESSELTEMIRRPSTWKGNRTLISGKCSLVKYCNLARIVHVIQLFGMSTSVLSKKGIETRFFGQKVSASCDGWAAPKFPQFSAL